MTLPAVSAPARPPVVTAEEAVTIGVELPTALMSMLERRYLSGFDPAHWSIAAPEDDGGRPLLREVLGLGRERDGDDRTEAMPHVLAATHALGQATVMVLQGEGDRHRLFLGGRRLTRSPQGSTEDFIEGQSGVLHANLAGLVLGDAARLDGAELTGLAEFLRTAPAAAAVTGIPSRHRHDATSFQNIDRVVAAAGRRRYAVVVVAEPLDAAALDLAVDRCRILRSEIHALVRRTVTQTRGESDSRSSSAMDEKSARSEMLLPASLYALAGFCAVAGMSMGPGLASLVTPLMIAANVGRGPFGRQPATQSESSTRTSGTAGTTELLDANAEACEDLLRRHIERLERARSTGGWRTAVYVIAESDGALEAVTGALRGIASGADSALDPVRVVRVAPHLVRSAALRGRTLDLRPVRGGVGHPLGPTFDALATCTTSDELAVLLTPPRRDVPGLPQQDIAEFALSAPPPTDRSITIGDLRDAVGTTLGPVSLTSASLNRHVFVTGMTGYGKTTTAKRLLVEATTELGLPFLVIEPVKAEYRSLREHPALRDRLRVFSVGDEPGTLPLRLNPFVPVESVPLLRHIDLLKAVFNAAFPMVAGMSYVLEEAMLQAYTDRGWDLYSSTNDLLGPHPGPDELGALVPSVADLHDKVEQVLAGKQYAREVHQNMGAALRSRLRSLLVGTKGMTLGARRSVPAHDLFSEPCVIELRNLGDDEEKAFVMALLLGQLYEYAEARQAEHRSGGDPLQHLTLIEEAHRLLASVRSGGAESPDAQAKAVTLFTDMLAEMRAYGEGFIVADQIPSKLAPETLKNSNVKILHRLVAPDDRAVAAASINLTEAQSRQLGTLQPGTAIVHDDRNSSAVLVRMAPLAASDTAALDVAATGPVRSTDRSYLHLNGACHGCPRPCAFLGPARRVRPEQELDLTLAPLLADVLAGDGGRARERFSTWRGAWVARARERVPVAADQGGPECAFGQSAHRWLERRLRERAQAVGLAGPDGVGLLALERCARAAAELAAAWRDGDGDAVFPAVHRRWADALSGEPPREMPGCVECPSRCTELDAVIALPAEGRSGLAVRAANPASPGVVARSLGKAHPAVQKALESRTDAGDQARFLYCAVTVATADAQDAPVDLLAQLRTGAASPG